MMSDESMSEQGNVLREHLWQSRVLVIFASECNDSRIAEQRRIVSSMGSGAAERDMAVVEFVGAAGDTQAMRRQLGIPENGFQAVLVGKDGGAKLRSAQPLTAEKLAATIDAMPMRRQEMQAQLNAVPMSASDRQETFRLSGPDTNKT